MVALTLTVKPLAFAALIAATATSNTPFCDTELVVMILQAVEMDGKEQIGRRLEQMQLLLEQHSVRAEGHELLALDEAAHDLADLLVDQRLPAGNGDHRRAAFLRSVPALLRSDRRWLRIGSG